jgi:hypothetical protein
MAEAGPFGWSSVPSRLKGGARSGPDARKQAPLPGMAPRVLMNALIQQQLTEFGHPFLKHVHDLLDRFGGTHVDAGRGQSFQGKL